MAGTHLREHLPDEPRVVAGEPTFGASRNTGIFLRSFPLRQVVRAFGTATCTASGIGTVVM